MRKYKTIRGLFAKPERWLKGAMGAKQKNEQNYAISDCLLTSPELACVCLEGAIRYVYPTNQRSKVRQKLRALIEKISFSKESIITWNDTAHRRYEDVVKLVRRAGV